MLFSICYLFLYSIIDGVLIRTYLSNFNISHHNILIDSNKEFYQSLVIINTFIVIVYCMYIIYYLFVNRVRYIYSLLLALIYFRYTINIFINDRILLYEYEFSRNIMWVFTTPLMLYMYADINNITLYDIKLLYHIIPCILNIFIYPFRDNILFYYTYSIILSIPMIMFIRNLYLLYNIQYTKIIIYIWGIFVSLHVLELTQLCDKYTINMLYLSADMIGKMMTTFVIHHSNEQTYIISQNIDLQCINFISYITHKITNYNINNVKQSVKCANLINYLTNKLNNFIPENKQELQLELLKKILPFNFDDKYIDKVSTDNPDPSMENRMGNPQSNINANKEFKMICVLFTDIVSYTELAKKYDDRTIFKLLNDVYIRFDAIIKRYSHLQKIETIGDAYMVVGDIYNEDNYKTAVKEIMLLALDYIREIKIIKTPDKKPLSIRIGIHIGSVIVGILGNEVPRLCVVGNTVNMAARLQSTTDNDTIQLSKELYDIIKDINFNTNISFKIKEGVFLKNIGNVYTYNIYPQIYSTDEN